MIRRTVCPTAMALSENYGRTPRFTAKNSPHIKQTINDYIAHVTTNEWMAEKKKARCGLMPTAYILSGAFLFLCGTRPSEHRINAISQAYFYHSTYTRVKTQADSEQPCFDPCLTQSTTNTKATTTYCSTYIYVHRTQRPPGARAGIEPPPKRLFHPSKRPPCRCLPATPAWTS